MVLRRQKRPHAPTRYSEPDISVFCERIVESPGQLGYVLRHPRESFSALSGIGRLPRMSCPLKDGQGQALRHVLHRPAPPLLRPLLALRSVLIVPAEADVYMTGRERQTLRRKSRVAERAGVTVRAVQSDAERRDLLDLLIVRERQHPNLTYRVEDPDLGHLLEADLWLVARSDDGSPLLVAVAPVQGQWALLSYFRTLEDGDVAGASRYLSTAVLVEHLRQRGVRYLLDPASPFRLPNGLRHFQRMLGWRLMQVRVTRA